MKFNKSKKDAKFVSRLYFLVLNIIRISLVFAIASALFTQRWTVVFVSVLTLLLTLFPYLFEKRYKIDIPIEFEILVVIFIYASIFLGEVHEYYIKFWWWDIFLHFSSAMALGFIGFIFLYVLYKGDKIKANPSLVALFSFFFALGLGAVWEIFEFGMDQIFGLNMQKSGLIDTMADLIVDSFGALIASFAGYLYLKKEETFIFKKMVNSFAQENPKLFSDK